MTPYRYPIRQVEQYIVYQRILEHSTPMLGEAMILLVNPNLMKPPVTPVALDYLGQTLEQAGFQTGLLDLSFEQDPSSAIRGALSGDEHLVAVTVRNIDDCYYTSQDFCLDRTREIISEIREYTSAPIVVGGVGYSIFPKEALDFLKADAGVIGEGEEVLCNLAAGLTDGKDLTAQPGLLLRGARIVDVLPAEPPNLAEMDLSHRSVVDNARYFREGAMAGFETKRGCNQKCIYCPEPGSKGSIIRVRDPENVAQELENLLNQGVDTFHTCDSEFNLPPDHAIEVCNAIVRRGLGDRIRWYAYAVPHPFPEELAVAMRRAGCVGIDFGADHAHEGMLARLGRRHREEHLWETAERCRRHGMVTMYDLLLGGPGETRESIAYTVDIVKSVAVDRVGVAFGARIYPRTALGNLVNREGFHSDNPSLHGSVNGNTGFLRPVYYVSASLGDDIGPFLHDLIGEDDRFLFGGTEPSDHNYNYNDNSVLAEAIRSGARGAFWDILRRVSS
ncbi:MAG: radical SAM protein [bacterium]